MSIYYGGSKIIFNNEDLNIIEEKSEIIQVIKDLKYFKFEFNKKKYYFCTNNTELSSLQINKEDIILNKDTSIELEEFQEKLLERNICYRLNDKKQYFCYIEKKRAEVKKDKTVLDNLIEHLPPVFYRLHQILGSAKLRGTTIILHEDTWKSKSNRFKLGLIAEYEQLMGSAKLTNKETPGRDGQFKKFPVDTRNANKDYATAVNDLISISLFVVKTNPKDYIKFLKVYHDSIQEMELTNGGNAHIDTEQLDLLKRVNLHDIFKDGYTFISLDLNNNHAKRAAEAAAKTPIEVAEVMEEIEQNFKEEKISVRKKEPIEPIIEHLEDSITNIYTIIKDSVYIQHEYNIPDQNKSLKIYYDNLYILWNVHKDDKLKKIYWSYVIVDPANIHIGMKYFVKKQGCPGGGFASKAIYNNYKITETVDINYMIDENGRDFVSESEDIRNSLLVKYKAIGIKYYNKVWIIHVHGPDLDINNWKYKPPYNFVYTYISVFKVFLEIKKKEPWLNLRFSLISLGSFLKSALITFEGNKTLEIIRIQKKCLNDVGGSVLKMFDKEEIDILNDSNISFALGEDYDVLKPE